MKKLLLIISLLLIGCASNTQPKTVMVPVAVKCPAPTIPPAQPLPIKGLSDNSTPDVVMKSYVTTVATLKNENEDLRERLRVYQ
jgi:uncharacterized protein YcfL